MSRTHAFTGELGIDRHSKDLSHTVRITVRDRGNVLELECTAEDFLLALTGRGALPVSVVVNMDRLERT